MILGSGGQRGGAPCGAPLMGAARAIVDYDVAVWFDVHDTFLVSDDLVVALHKTRTPG